MSKKDEIIADFNKGLRQIDIALKYKVSKAYISKIVKKAKVNQKLTYNNKKNLTIEKLLELDQKLMEYSEGVVGAPNNWDGQGSKAITIESWNLATMLLRNILFNLWTKGVDVPIPLVLANTDNSFDVYWDAHNFELLLNVPPKREELVHIYGEKQGAPEYELEARMNYDFIEGVVVEWLKKIL